MCPDNSAQEAPCAGSPVHSQHAQDLKEPQASESCCCEVLVLVLIRGDHSQDNAGHNHSEIYLKWFELL